MSKTLRHLGLNFAFLTPGETGGMEVYAREFVPALKEARPDLRITAFSNKNAAPALSTAPWLEGVRLQPLPLGSGPAAWVLNEQLALPLATRRAQVDLCHSLASTGPGWLLCPSVVTVQDLIYARYPDAHSGLRSLGMRMLVPLAVHRAKRVIAASEATAKDLVDLLGVDRRKIDVVHHGMGLSRKADPTPSDELRRRYGLGNGPWVLAVSARRAHKNLPRLLEAFSRLDLDPAPELVLPGYATGAESELRTLAQTLGIADRVHLLGWVDEAELEGLYAAGTCFAFPSLYEGFGLPVLEAMARGLPVACANRASLPEVAGDAALLFDPESIDAIADALRRLLTDGDLRKRLAEAGHKQAEGFTWRHAAELTLETYERALAPG